VEGNTCHIVVPPGDQSALRAEWDWNPPEGHSLLEVVRPEGGLVQSDVGGIYESGGPGYPLVCGFRGPEDGWNVCSQVYPDGTTVTLSAEPMEGYRFTGWTGGGCSGVEPCVIEMEEWTKVEASFEEIQGSLFPVTVQVEEGGELPVGSVVSEPEGIHCGDGNDQCQAEFPAGEQVVLKHVWPELDLGSPTIGGTGFGGWAGDCSGFDACVLTVDGPKETVATAADELVQFSFVGWIYPSREGFGVPGEVTWGPTWEEPGRQLWEYIWYNDGMNSNLEYRVRVAPGLRTTISSPVGPVNWLEGCESVEGNTCHIVVPPGPGGLGVQAVWEWSPPQGHSLIHVVRPEFGLVQSDVGGIYFRNGEGYPLSCGRPGGWWVCGQVYPDGTTVTLTAEPLSGYRFTGWTGGGCSGTDPCEVVMEEWTRVEASFERVTLGTGFGLEQFSPIPAGTFQMGDGRGDARPIHTVNLTRDFYLQRTEVTQAQWQEIMGENPSRRVCDLCPVDHVSWDDIQTFLARLNAAYPDAGFRLPTEAQWEYAARAGTTGDFGGTGVLDEMGWYSENAGHRTHPVALKFANAWGLYDMHGNVLEWVHDRYSATYYSESPTDDPTGPSSGVIRSAAMEGGPSRAGTPSTARVLRGGSWGSVAVNARSATRIGTAAEWGGGDYGFRLVRTR